MLYFFRVELLCKPVFSFDVSMHCLFCTFKIQTKRKILCPLSVCLNFSSQRQTISLYHSLFLLSSDGEFFNLRIARILFKTERTAVYFVSAFVCTSEQLQMRPYLEAHIQSTKLPYKSVFIKKCTLDNVISIVLSPEALCSDSPNLSIPRPQTSVTL